jgi:hypothetical protein
MAPPQLVMNILEFVVSMSTGGGCMVFIREVLKEFEEVWRKP